MAMFFRIFKQELLAIFRDSMNLFFMFFPAVMGVIGYFLIPYLETQFGSESIVGEIVTLVLITMTGYIFGAITAFTLLDDKDDQVLLALRITPYNVRKYILAKLFISYLFGVTGTLLIVIGTGMLNDVSAWHLIMIALVSALQGPIVALIVNAFATNKVEGFVMMKMTGLLLMIPIAAFFMTDWTELFLGIIPGFWPARLISMELLPLDFLFAQEIYFVLGIGVNILLAYVLFKHFIKITHI